MPEERLGPASLALPFNGAALVGDRLVVVTRNVTPTSVAVVDVRTWEVQASTDLPAGTGAWGVVASGDVVYLGQQQPRGSGPNLHRYDLDEDRLTGVAIIDTTVIWDLAAGADGTVYGVGRDVEPFAYDPDSGLARLIGNVPDVEILRSVTVAGGEVVLGGRRAGTALLLAMDPATGHSRSVLPRALAEDTIVYTLASADGATVVAGTEGPGGQRPAIARIPLGDPEAASVVRLDDENLVDALAVDGTTSFAMARPSGAVWRVAGSAARQLATPVPHAEHRGLFRHRGALIGVSAAERVFRMDADGDSPEVADLAEHGLEPRPERAQSLAAHEGVVWVGGNFSLQRIDVRSRARERVFVPGEPKDLLADGEAIWLALYPGGEVWRGSLDQAPTRVASLPAEHNRPVSLARDSRTGRILVTAASDRLGGGSLSVVDGATGTVTTLTHPFADAGRPPAGLAVHDGIAYVGGSRSDPSIAAVSIDDDRRLWETTVPDAQTMIGLAAAGERVCGFTPDGWLVVLAASDGRILHREQLPHPGGRLVVAGAALYGVGRDTLVHIDPHDGSWEVIRDGLDAIYWNHAFAAADGTHVFVLAGLDLLAVPLR